MNTYNRLNDELKEGFEELIFDGENHIDIIKKQNFENVILLGLNPSSSAIDNKTNEEINLKDNNFLNWIPKVNDDDFENIYQSIKKDNLVYEKYFKKPFEMLSEFGYGPFWTNPEIGEIILNEKLKENKITTEQFNYLISFPIKYNKYAYAVDLFTIRITNSNVIKDKINPKLKNKDDKKFVLEAVREKIYNIIETYKPKLILCNNAFVSSLISEAFMDIKSTSIEVIYNEHKTIIVFSSIMTNGNLDRYSFERLKKEVTTYLE